MDQLSRRLVNHPRVAATQRTEHNFTMKADEECRIIAIHFKHVWTKVALRRPPTLSETVHEVSCSYVDVGNNRKDSRFIPDSPGCSLDFSKD